ncbi:hypothetical protein Tco_0806716 [Tanacetum coccineum]
MTWRVIHVSAWDSHDIKAKKPRRHAICTIHSQLKNDMSPTSTCWDRITRLSSGLYPNLWTPEAFHIIASNWGKVIIPEECYSRQFNHITGKVCILTTHLELIHTTSYVQAGKNLTPVRIRETDGDIDSLFNGYSFDSSSDEDDTVFDNDTVGDNLGNESNDEDDDYDELEDGDEEKELETSTSLLVDGVKDNTKNIPSDKLGCRCGAQCVSDSDDRSANATHVSQTPPLHCNSNS